MLVLDQRSRYQVPLGTLPRIPIRNLQYIQGERLEIVEGFVDQPDMNLPSEEALIEDAQIGRNGVEQPWGQISQRVGNWNLSDMASEHQHSFMIVD